MYFLSRVIQVRLSFCALKNYLLISRLDAVLTAVHGMFRWGRTPVTFPLKSALVHV